MKDIDFDELDRAVSSVLGQNTPKVAAEKSVEVKPVVNTSNDTASFTPSSSNPPKPSQQFPQTVTRPTLSPDETTSSPEKSRMATPLAVKRRGRFMDVMHPSAGAPVSYAPAPSHGAVKLEPLTTKEDTSPEVETETPELATEPTAVLDESNTLIGAEPTAVDTELTPSPLENPVKETHPGDHLLEANYDDDIKKQDKPDEPAATELPDLTPIETETTEIEPDESTEPDEPVETSSLVNSVPQTTPFLTDTKVDKRPLGGAPANPADQTFETSALPDMQSAPEVPLPRELQPDVVQVESVQEDDEIEATGPGSKPFATNVEAAPDPQDDGRVEGHPLFDTSTYHEPIAAVQGKSSIPGWVKWLIGLTLCLVVGAGVGYFLFTAGL